MFTSNVEESFFLSHIDNTKKVLEYGSGMSTLEIARHAKEIISMEHQAEWYAKNISQIPENCKLFLRTPNLPYREGGHCGTYDEFKDYIETPLEYAPFDVILIDGRARVACSSICHKLGHKNTVIFIHDFERPEYHEALKYLYLIETREKMAKLKLKQHD